MVSLPQGVVARVSGPKPRHWDSHGQVTSADARAGTSLKQKVLNFILPGEMEGVHEDYPTYRKWHALATASKQALGFLGTQGVVTGLAAALNTGLPFVGGVVASLGLSGLLTFGLKDGLNWVGNLVGGSMAHKVDEDPAKWLKVAGSVRAAANAVQGSLVAVPGLFLALAPLSGLAGAWADNLKASADVKVQHHQASPNGLAEMVGKDKNQDMLSGMVGSAVGAASSIVGHALLAPVLGPLAPLAVLPVALGLNLYANHRAARALHFDNLTGTSVAKIAHRRLSGAEAPRPDEMDFKLPNDQPEVVLGADGSTIFQDPAHRDKVLDLYGSTPYLVDVHSNRISVTLRSDATDRDVLQAAWQSQLLADVVTSPGYRQLEKEVGAEAAALRASELTLAAVSDLDDELRALEAKGWDLSHPQIRAGDVRVDWVPRERTEPLPAVSDRSLRDFMLGPPAR